MVCREVDTGSLCAHAFSWFLDNPQLLQYSRLPETLSFEMVSDKAEGSYVSQLLIGYPNKRHWIVVNSYRHRTND